MIIALWLVLNSPKSGSQLLRPIGHNQMLESELFLHEMVMKYGIEIRAPNVMKQIYKGSEDAFISFIPVESSIFQKFFLDIQLLKFWKICGSCKQMDTQGKIFWAFAQQHGTKAAAHWNEIGIKELSRRRPMFTTENYDGLLVSFKTEKFQNNHQLTQYKNIDVGYTRGQSQWLKEIENSKVELEMLKRFENGFIFWPLSIIKRDERGNQIFVIPLDIYVPQILKERPEIGVVSLPPTTEKTILALWTPHSKLSNQQCTTHIDK